MEFISDLWMPIVVSAVLVFIASFLCHMVLPIHKGEWSKLPDEPKAMDALGGTPAGNYMFPWGSMADMKDPEFIARQTKGPTGSIVIHPGRINMGSNLVLTFLYFVLTSIFIGYVLWHAFHGVKQPYLDVFRIAGATGLMAYFFAMIPHAIWYKTPKLGPALIDAIVYALVAAGTFGWLWHMPHAGA